MFNSKQISVLALLLLIATSSIYPRIASAYALPTVPGASHYITSSWGEVIGFNGAIKIKAYQYGYNAFVGDPYTYIILDFGRQQFMPGSGTESGWGVNLVGDESSGNGYKTNAWVQEVAQAFIDGYNDGHTSESEFASVIIGTSNGNYPWTCDNNNVGNLDPSWYRSGIQWGSLVNSISWQSRAYAHAGIDIESWYDPNLFGNWVACGAGALRWFDGFQTQSGNYIYNFGSNAYVEYPQQWTQEQLYQVSYEIWPAHSMPQIYCNNYALQWVSARQYKYMIFSGVTSDNAIALECNNKTVRSYTWDNSWSRLNDELNNAGFTDTLGPGVTSFFYPR